MGRASYILFRTDGALENVNVEHNLVCDAHNTAVVGLNGGNCGFFMLY